MKTSHPVLRQSVLQAKQASLQRRQSLERPPAAQASRTSSWAKAPTTAPAGRGIDRPEASMSKLDYRPMSGTFG